MSYHMKETGSARSVGPRRIKKRYVTKGGKVIIARSVADASRLAAATYPGDPLDRSIVGAAPASAMYGAWDDDNAASGVTAPAAPQLNLTATNAAAAAAADFAALAGPPIVAATPVTPWTTGQYVTLDDGSKAHWNGSAWVAGPA